MNKWTVTLVVGFLSLLFLVLQVNADTNLSTLVAKPLIKQSPIQSGKIIGYLLGSGRALAVRGNYAYVGFGEDLAVIDISDKTTPKEVGRLTVSQMILDVVVKDNYAYLGTIDGLQIIDISQPNDPQWQSIFQPIPMTRIKIRGDYGYVLSSEGLFILDMMNAPQLATVSHFEREITNPLDLDLINNYVFILIGALESTLLIIDISDNSQPNLVHSQQEYANQIAITGNRYLDIDNACSQICDTILTVYSWKSMDWQFRGLYAYHNYGSTLTLAVETDGLFSYMGRDVGFYVYSLYETNALMEWFDISNARDIQVVEDYIYIISEDFGVESGFYILPAPPVYRTYMPFVPNQ